MVDVKRLLVGLLALTLLGCGGLSTQAARYLKQSEPFQVQLSYYQRELKLSSNLPLAQREARVRELLGQVEAGHAQLRRLNPPRSVSAVHQELDTLYLTMENFLKACLSGSGDTSDPKVQQLAREWTQHLDQLQKELQKLEH